MLGLVRKYRTLPVLLVAAMAWGFAAPIVHLACGAAAGEMEVLCGETPASAKHERDHAASHGSKVPIQVGAAHPASDHAELECCQVEVVSVDRRAPLPAFPCVPNAPAEAIGIQIDAPKPVIPLLAEADFSPPIAFRVLFSVFLI